MKQWYSQKKKERCYKALSRLHRIAVLCLVCRFSGVWLPQQTPMAEDFFLVWIWCSIQVLRLEPVMVLVEHVVIRLHLSPLVDAEDAIWVVSVLADAMQLIWIPPLLGQVLLYAHAVVMDDSVHGAHHSSAIYERAMVLSFARLHQQLR